MSKEELLKEIVANETRISFIESKALVGTYIEVKQYGVGIIEDQDEHLTRVRFDDQEIELDSSELEEKYYDKSSLQKLKQDIKEKRILLNDGSSPEELIKKLLSLWSQWDKYEDEYLNKVAYDLVKYPDFKTNEAEATILDELKRKMSGSDWNNLPKYIADVHFDRKLEFIDG